MGDLKKKFRMNKFVALFALVAVASAQTKKRTLPTKSHMIASMLSLSGTAFMGIDRFYMGYWLFGALKAISFGGAGIWAVIDAVWINWCWLKDAEGGLLTG